MVRVLQLSYIINYNYLNTYQQPLGQLNTTYQLTINNNQHYTRNSSNKSHLISSVAINNEEEWLRTKINLIALLVVSARTWVLMCTSGHALNYYHRELSLIALKLWGRCLLSKHSLVHLVNGSDPLQGIGVWVLHTVRSLPLKPSVHSL